MHLFAPVLPLLRGGRDQQPTKMGKIRSHAHKCSNEVTNSEFYAVLYSPVHACFAGRQIRASHRPAESFSRFSICASIIHSRFFPIRFLHPSQFPLQATKVSLDAFGAKEAAAGLHFIDLIFAFGKGIRHSGKLQTSTEF